MFHCVYATTSTFATLCLLNVFAKHWHCLPGGIEKCLCRTLGSLPVLHLLWEEALVPRGSLSQIRLHCVLIVTVSKVQSFQDAWLIAFVNQIRDGRQKCTSLLNPLTRFDHIPFYEMTLHCFLWLDFTPCITNNLQNVLYWLNCNIPWMHLLHITLSSAEMYWTMLMHCVSCLQNSPAIKCSIKC